MECIYINMIKVNVPGDGIAISKQNKNNHTNRCESSNASGLNQSKTQSARLNNDFN